jgi:hypothetical protein
MRRTGTHLEMDPMGYATVVYLKWHFELIHMMINPWDFMGCPLKIVCPPKGSHGVFEQRIDPKTWWLIPVSWVIAPERILASSTKNFTGQTSSWTTGTIKLHLVHWRNRL